MTTSTQVMSSAPPRAWYRHPWPWMLIAGPAVVVLAGLFTAWLAVRSDDGLVADDYYKRGLLINRQIERSDRAAGIGATVTFGSGGVVKVRLSGAGDALPATLRLRIAHPTRAGHDRSVILAPTSSGEYLGVTGELARGRWLVTLETEAWRLPTAEIDAPVDAVALGAVPAGTRQP